VLVVRVHPKILEGQKLPQKLVTDGIWQERYESIRDFERHMARNGTAVLKFFLHVSKEEQLQRFLDRIEEPGKRWKFSMGDVAERKLWDKYQESYEEAIRATATPHAPWYVVPADKKWFTRLVVARAIVDTLEKLNPQFPKVDGAALDELMKVREALLAEKKSQR
jgi:polyphosphate kinase 2 (PPK2 family)